MESPTPGADTVSQVIIDWGDGTTKTYDAWTNLSHRYAEGPATHSITASLVDEDGRHLLDSTVGVTVANLPPQIEAITGDLAGMDDRCPRAG